MYDIMLKPIARIFYRGEVVAYRLQDNTGKIIDYNPQEFYIAAKDGIVVNCKASGGVVSGINGFELKKLQTIKQRDKIIPVGELVVGSQYTVGYLLKCEDPQEVIYGSYHYKMRDVIIVPVTGVDYFKDKLYGAVVGVLAQRFGEKIYYLAQTSDEIYIQKIEIADKNTNTSGKPWVLKPDFYGFKSLITVLEILKEVDDILDYNKRLMRAYKSEAPNGESNHMQGILMGLSCADEVLEVAKRNLAADPVWGDMSKSDEQIQKEAMDASNAIIDRIIARQKAKEADKKWLDGLSDDEYFAEMDRRERARKMENNIEKINEPKIASVNTTKVEPRKNIEKVKGMRGIFDFFKR